MKTIPYLTRCKISKALTICKFYLMQNKEIVIFHFHNENQFYMVHNVETLIFANFKILYYSKYGNFNT